MRRLTSAERLARSIKQLQIKENLARQNLIKAEKKWVKTGDPALRELRDSFARKQRVISDYLVDLIIEQKYGVKRKCH